MTAVTIRHNFETAHRLPHLGGKCQSLHGHSWWAEVTITGDTDPDGVVMDFGTIKSVLRTWIDGHLDHGTMLGHTDPLAAVLYEHGTKLFLFDGHGLTDGLWWPTVENVAEMLRRVAITMFLLGPERSGSGDLSVTRVRVTETHVNAAEVTA